MAGPAETEWFAFVNGQSVGPMTAQGLAELALSQRLRGTDLIWCDRLPDWVELRMLLDGPPAAPAFAASPRRQPAHVQATPTGRPSSLSSLYLAGLSQHRQQRGGAPAPPAIATKPIF